MTVKKATIAIDGHSSCGKSTFAMAIAARLNYLYIDSGAMYRAVTLAFLENSVLRGDKLNDGQVQAVLDNIHISFKTESVSMGAQTLLNGRDVESRIREIDVASRVSIVSKSAIVRDKLVQLQREMGSEGAIVMDGRDIGTVVFPGADLKIFMTADPAIRAERRYKELLEKGHKVNLEEIRDNIMARDRLDESRPESPLRMAHDAVLLDNSHMTPGQQMIWFEKLWSELKL